MAAKRTVLGLEEGLVESKILREFVLLASFSLGCCNDPPAKSDHFFGGA